MFGPSQRPPRAWVQPPIPNNIRSQHNHITYIFYLGPGVLPWASRHQNRYRHWANFNQSYDSHFHAGPITLRGPIRRLDTQEPTRMWEFWNFQPNWSDFVIKYTDWSDFVKCPMLVFLPTIHLVIILTSIYVLCLHLEVLWSPWLDSPCGVWMYSLECPCRDSHHCIGLSILLPVFVSMRDIHFLQAEYFWWILLPPFCRCQPCITCSDFSIPWVCPLLIDVLGLLNDISMTSRASYPMIHRQYQFVFCARLATKSDCDADLLVYVTILYSMHAAAVLRIRWTVC